MEIPEPEKPQLKLPKLKAFKTIRKTFSMLGIRPALATQSIPFNVRLSMGFLLLCTGVTSSTMYFFNVAEIFSEYTQSIYITSAGLLCTVIVFILILRVKQFFEFINHFDIALNMTLKYSPTRSIFGESNRLEEKWCKILIFVFVKVTTVCTAVPSTIYTFFIYFTTDLGSAAFSLPLSMWFPFNCENPLGFLIAATIQYAIAAYGLTFCACVFGLAVGSFLYVIALKNIIKATLFHLSRNIRAKIDQTVLLEQLNEFLELHSHAKQLVCTFSDMFQDFIALVFVGTLITISGALLMIQIQLAQGGDNLLALSLSIIEFSYAFFILFCDCEMGQRVNLAYVECSYMVDQLEWYLLPVTMQRMLPLMLNFTQQPFNIKCFGSTRCDRYTFKSVIKTAFSYFTVLREFYN